MSCDLEAFTFGTIVFKGCLDGDFDEEKHNLRHWQQLQTAADWQVLLRDETSSWRDMF